MKKVLVCLMCLFTSLTCLFASTASALSISPDSSAQVFSTDYYHLPLATYNYRSDNYIKQVPFDLQFEFSYEYYYEAEHRLINDVYDFRVNSYARYIDAADSSDIKEGYFEYNSFDFVIPTDKITNTDDSKILLVSRVFDGAPILDRYYTGGDNKLLTAYYNYDDDFYYLYFGYLYVSDGFDWQNVSLVKYEYLQEQITFDDYWQDDIFYNDDYVFDFLTFDNLPSSWFIITFIDNYGKSFSFGVATTLSGDKVTYSDLNNISINNNKINQAWQNGFQLGVVEGKHQATDVSEFSFLSLLTSVVDAPIKVITNAFDFNLPILDVNIKDMLFTLFTLALIIGLCRLFLGGKNET